MLQTCPWATDSDCDNSWRICRQHKAEAGPEYKWAAKVLQSTSKKGEKELERERGEEGGSREKRRGFINYDFYWNL